jgi:hypothetical protein
MESAMMKAALAGARRSSEDMGSQALPDKMSLLRIRDNGTSVFVGTSGPPRSTTIINTLQARRPGFQYFRRKA